MAKAGDKRRLEENRKHLQKLKILIAVANAAFVGTRFALQRQEIIGWYGAAITLSVILYAFCYSGIAAALSPHYSSTGELIYSGADLKTGGVLSYYHDVIYLLLFSQLLGTYTNYAWLALLAIPGYALYTLVVNVLLPSWSSPSSAGGDGSESEVERKRREKRERQTARAERFASQQRGGGTRRVTT